MDETFVRIKRSFLHSSLWLSRDTKSIREAFLDILLSVNNEPRPVFINNKRFECGRFQSLKSVSTWANRWNVKKERAYYYLRRLKKMEYIRIENMKFTTRITVLEAQRFLYLGSDSYKESVNGFTTGKNEKSQRIKDSKQESSSEPVNGKKNDLSTKQVEDSTMFNGKILKGISSSLNSNLSELEKEKIESNFFERERKNFEKNGEVSKERMSPETTKTEHPAIKTLIKVLELETIGQTKNFTESLKPETWEKEIAELEQFFKTATLPGNPIRLSQCEVITDVWLFINSHLATVKANNHKQTFLPYLNRLQDLKQYLTTNIN